MSADSTAGAGGSEPEDVRIGHAAADWRARQDRGLTAAEQEDFLCWLEADPRHAEQFGEMADAWTALDRVRELPLAKLEPAVPARPAQHRRAAPWRWAAVSLAAAAALVLGFWPARPGAESALRFAESTPADEDGFKRVNLPDGSVVRLRAATAIDVHYDAGARIVRLLRGAAFFTVARDAARPFLVEAGGVGVRAIGTAFTVAHRPDAVEVLVTEGRVSVDPARPRAGGAPGIAPVAGAGLPVLGAGERTIVATGAPDTAPPVPAIEQLSAGQLAAAVAWQERLLAFEATPLADIVAQFNRFNRHQLIVADAALGRRRFGGSFRADDPEGFVALLAATADIAVERREHDTLLRRR